MISAHSEANRSAVARPIHLEPQVTRTFLEAKRCDIGDYLEGRGGVTIGGLRSIKEKNTIVFTTPRYHG